MNKNNLFLLITLTCASALNGMEPQEIFALACLPTPTDVMPATWQTVITQLKEKSGLLSLEHCGIIGSELDAIINALPKTIKQNIHVLHISANYLVDLPESIGQLTALRELGVSNCFLRSIPDSIGQLLNLQQVNLSHNCLISLPGSIAQLVALQTLSVYYNKLHALPQTIMQLKKLLLIFVDNHVSIPELNPRVVIVRI